MFLKILGKFSIELKTWSYSYFFYKAVSGEWSSRFRNTVGSDNASRYFHVIIQVDIQYTLCVFLDGSVRHFTCFMQATGMTIFEI